MERGQVQGGQVQGGQGLPKTPRQQPSLPPFINPSGKPRVSPMNGTGGPGYVGNNIPLSAKTGVGGLKSLKEVVQVPPPLSSNSHQKRSQHNSGSSTSKASSVPVSPSSVSAQQQLMDTLANNSSDPPRTFPELNITVKTVPKHSQAKLGGGATAAGAPSPNKGRKLSELDDLENELERELEELDDVEPDAGGISSAPDMFAEDDLEPPGQTVRVKPTPPKQMKPPQTLPPPLASLQAPNKEKKVEALQFVRRADGKGFVRKGGVKPHLRINLKSKGSVNKNKKKKKAFRGGNYRFDGSAIKKRPAPKKKDAQPSEESSGAAEPATYQSGAQIPVSSEQPETKSSKPPTPQPQTNVLESLGLFRKGPGSEEQEEQIAVKKPLKQSSEIISQSKPIVSSPPAASSVVPAHLAVKRKVPAGVGVHESGLAFLKKLKVDPGSDAKSQGQVAPSRPSVDEPLTTNADELVEGATTPVPVVKDSILKELKDSDGFNAAAYNSSVSENGYHADLYAAAGVKPPRKAKQLALEANEKVLKAGSLQSLESWSNALANGAAGQGGQTQAPAVEAMPVPIDYPQKPCVCFCDEPDENLKPASSDLQKKVVTCQAIESVGGAKIGCRNKVTDFRLRRTSINSPTGRLLCDEHIQRLKAHQACVFCGQFCAYGIFMMCRPSSKCKPHLFHRKCFVRDSKSKQCPHCKTDVKPIAVQLRLQMDRMPLALLTSVSKMSFPAKGKKSAASKHDEEPPKVSHKLPNGKVISSARLPEGMSDASLAKVIEALEDTTNIKHTTRNMFIPCKAGDNVKLMQLLSLGYSPQQRFGEAEAVGGTPLHVAATEGHVLTAHILVQAGAELDALDDEQSTALMLACNYGQTAVVRYLLQAGADMTLKGDDGMTCLHLATQNGHLECAQAILDQKNTPRKFLNSQDDGGWTPLVWACENKHESVIEFLLIRGADPLITDAEGNIAIHWGALSGSRATCELLLNHNCNINSTNNLGETPMHIALRQDHYECAVLFLMRGANLNIENKDSKKPVELMTSKDAKCRTIVRLTTLLQSLMKDTKQYFFEKIISNDITNGKESLPIQCVNDLDYEGVPTNYVYVTSNCVTSNIPIDRSIATLQHCQCTDKCSSEDSCNCSDLSVKSWYDQDGRLKEDFDYVEPPMIFECNEMCRCNVNACYNRVLQHGITARLQVFRAYGMGWGVRAAQEIPKGSFVCEYIGEIISDSEAETREDSYLFDLESRDGDTYCIDAHRYRNVTGLINHLCTPNLTPVKVFTNHQDLRFPHIAMFANRDIKKGEELGFDYGEKFWVIKHKQFTCHCTSDKCRYNKSNIQGFLKEYYRRIGEPMPPPDHPPSKTTTPAANPSSGKKVSAPPVKSSGDQSSTPSPSSSKANSGKAGSSSNQKPNNTPAGSSDTQEAGSNPRPKRQTRKVDTPSAESKT